MDSSVSHEIRNLVSARVPSRFNWPLARLPRAVGVTCFGIRVGVHRIGWSPHYFVYLLICICGAKSTPVKSINHKKKIFLLTPRCRVLLEQLTGLQPVKKFPAFHGTRRFITALTSVRHLSPSWASPIQSIYPHPTSCRSIQIIFYQKITPTDTSLMNQQPAVSRPTLSLVVVSYQHR